jgi:hypothetical protein
MICGSLSGMDFFKHFSSLGFYIAKWVCSRHEGVRQSVWFFIPVVKPFNTVIERKPPLNLFRSQGLLIKLQFTLKKNLCNAEENICNINKSHKRVKESLLIPKVIVNFQMTVPGLEAWALTLIE